MTIPFLPSHYFQSEKQINKMQESELFPENIFKNSSEKAF